MTTFSERTSENEAAAIELADDLCLAGCVCFARSRATTTLDDVDDFIIRWGGDEEVDLSDGLTAHVWNDVQPKGKGTPRGTLVVVDFGAFRVASFA